MAQTTHPYDIERARMGQESVIHVGQEEVPTDNQIINPFDFCMRLLSNSHSWGEHSQ